MSEHYKLPDKDPRLEFMTCRRYYKIRFDVTTHNGEIRENCEFAVKYKSLSEAEKASKVICQTKAYSNVRIAFICEYSSEVKVDK